MATNETVVVIKMNLSRCFYHTSSIEASACVLKWLSLAQTRSPAQKPACKDLVRNGLSPGHHAQGRLHSGF